MNYFRWQYRWIMPDELHQVFFMQEKLQGCWWVDTAERVYLQIGQVFVMNEVEQ